MLHPELSELLNIHREVANKYFEFRGAPAIHEFLKGAGLSYNNIFDTYKTVPPASLKWHAALLVVLMARQKAILLQRNVKNLRTQKIAVQLSTKFE